MYVCMWLHAHVFIYIHLYLSMVMHALRFIQDELLQLDVQWIPEEEGCDRGIFVGELGAGRSISSCGKYSTS